MDSSIRDQIISLIRAQPGLHLREVARQIGTSLALVEYHANNAAISGDLQLQSQGGFVRLFPSAKEFDLEDAGILSQLREENRRGILLALVSNEPIRTRELAKLLGAGKSRISFHTTKMIEAGIITKASEGFRISDRSRIQRLLESYSPPPVHDKFAAVWLAIYKQ